MPDTTPEGKIWDRYLGGGHSLSTLDELGVMACDYHTELYDRSTACRKSLHVMNDDDEY